MWWAPSDFAQLNTTMMSLVVKPRGIFHTFCNAGDERIRFIEIISSGNFKYYFAEIAPFLASGKPPELDKLMATAAKYGFEFDMSAAEGIIKKYGLQTPS